MPETKIYYQEGCFDPVYLDGTYHGYPVMMENQIFSGYYAGEMSYLNYFNQWGGRYRIPNTEEFVDRNIQLLAMPTSIFPKKIVSASSVVPNGNVTNLSSIHSLNPEGTFEGDKFRWYGTLQQIRIPACDSLINILGAKNFLTGGYHFPHTEERPANVAYVINDNTQKERIEQTRMNRQSISGTLNGQILNLTKSAQGASDTTLGANSNYYEVSRSNQVNVPIRTEGYILDINRIDWDEDNDQERETTKSYSMIKFPMLLSPQFKPWICFRLMTLKFKLSLNEWLNMQNDLPYRLNTLFWNKQNNDYTVQNTVYNQWDRSTMNSILAKPNPYGGTFKICKNKKIFINPFKGKTLINRIYSKKKGKIIIAKMWQPGQAPVATLQGNDYTRLGYYSNALYVSVLLGPLHVDRDFDAFTSKILNDYFGPINGKQSIETKDNYEYQLDRNPSGTVAWYERRTQGSHIPNMPAWLANTLVPYGIELYGQNEILIKTQTRYSEY